MTLSRHDLRAALVETIRMVDAKDEVIKNLTKQLLDLENQIYAKIINQIEECEISENSKDLVIHAIAR